MVTAIDATAAPVWHGRRTLVAGHSGYSLPAVMVVLAIVGATAAMAIPETLNAVDAWHARGAAFFVASRVALTRMQAVHRQTNVALQFVADDLGHVMRPFADANGNGVRTAEIAAGVDHPILPPERLDHLFPGARFGFIEGARLIDGAPAGPGSDAIRLGASDLLSFSPMGSCTPGTLYIRGRTQVQYAVVVLGATGRSRVLRFDAAARRWNTVE
jgi:type II secretory pathway pseudopilin PulG